MPSPRHVFLVLYAASGAAALVYEITWTRLLTLQMGQTVAAVSTVLAAFMSGLAAGSWIGGRFDRWSAGAPNGAGASRLQAYATLEILVALFGLALPAILAACVPVLAWAYDDALAPARFGFVRALLCTALLGVPAAAMGATFPIAAAWFAADGGTARYGNGNTAGTNVAAVGALYAANSAGAAIGALAAGFWLLAALGLRGTTYVGAALNLAAAAGALALARSKDRQRVVSAGDAVPAPSPRAARAAPEKSKRLRNTETVSHQTAAASVSSKRISSRLFDMLRVVPSVVEGRQTQNERRVEWPPAVVACAAAAISGLVALVYEVAWTRLLALVLGPTTYAFTIVVASFIVGIAIGSAGGARLVRRGFQPALWLGATLVVTAVAASASGWFAASRLPLIVASQVADPDVAFHTVIARQACGIAILLLPMTCALGAVFPLALATASAGQGTIGRDTARVYASNTFGAIVGSLAGGFVLLPRLGLDNTFRLAALIGLVAAMGVWTVALGQQRRARGRVAMMVTALVLATASVVLLPLWDLQLLASGAYKYAPYAEMADLVTELRTWRQLYYRDGAAATVTVRELAGMRSLVIDGKVDASNMGDMLTQRLLGLLPVLLHRDPQDICVIGLGSGVTVGSALARGTVRHADVVEISPEVVKASAFFERENRRALGESGVRLIVGDGRSHLLLTRRRYDVIVSEPSNPWMAGIAALFTQEFFAAARARLKPDGLVCQWAHTYDMSQADLQSIVRTFASVFPQATMWLVGENDLLLIGTNGAAIESNLAGLETRWREGTTASLLDDVSIAGRAAPFALLSLLAGGPADLMRYGSDAVIQRDDRMALEFSAPRAMYGRPTTDNAAIIRQLTEPGAGLPAARAAFAQATDVSWMVAGAMQLKADAYGPAYEHFKRAVRLNPRSAEALNGLTDAAVGSHRQDEAREWLESLARQEPDNALIRVELSRLLAAGGNMEPAAAAAIDAMRLAPNDPLAGEQLASVYADAGDVDHLTPLAEALLARFPSRDKPRYYRANALLLKGRAVEAVDQLRVLVARNPGDVRAQSLLGVACATSGRRDCALAAFAAALAANPRDTATYINLGVFQLQSADPAPAAESFGVALALDRLSAPARQGLAEARAALGAKP
jgi:spermidine synthase